MASTLEIRDLHVSVEGKEILKGVTLTVKTGEIHSIMGPNGSGKSTLALALMGHPKYEVTKGEILFKGQNIVELEPNERARLGLFLAFQYPQSPRPGVPPKFAEVTLPVTVESASHEDTATVGPAQCCHSDPHEKP
jgi:Fe-S cluster assembly ATP-binding protein